MARLVGLDLGTSYTRIWVQGRGIVLRCPSAAAIDSQSHEVVALGAEARRMLGKTPEDILAYRPIKDGVITDFEVASRMIGKFFSSKQISSTFNRPVVLLSTPYRITEVERLAVENAVLEAGARAVTQVPAIFAAAAGAGLRVYSPRGSMIVCMGGGITESAVISSGGIISARSLKVAGERFDMAIINYLRNRRDLLVGDTTAEMLKTRLGTADTRIDRGEMTVYGRNVRTGLASSRSITSAEICEAIMPAIDAVARTVLSTLDTVPPEIAGDVYAYGLMLCGGSALLPGLPAVLARKTGLRVTVAREPLDCVTLGLGRIHEHPTLWGEPLEYRLR